METSTISQPRATEWPPGMARRTRGRRESKVAYRNAPGHTIRNSIGGHSTFTTSSSPEDTFSRNEDNFQHESSPSQVFNTNDYFNVQRPSAGNPGYAPIVHQNFQDDNSSWYSLSANSYTLASNPPSSPQYAGGNNAQSPRSAVSQNSTGVQDMSWTSISRASPTDGSDLMLDIAMSDMDFGSLGSFDSMFIPTPSTTASDFSDGLSFPPVSSTASLQVSKDTPDLILPSKSMRLSLPCLLSFGEFASGWRSLLSVGDVSPWQILI
jgi:hypothetical protein